MDTIWIFTSILLIGARRYTESYKNYSLKFSMNFKNRKISISEFVYARTNYVISFLLVGMNKVL